MKLITSKDNPRLKSIRRLAQDSQAYRKLGLVWLEGDHLCRAALARGVKPELAIFSESIWQASEFEWSQCASEVWTVPDDVFAGLSGLESPAKMGFLMTLPTAPAINPLAATVVLGWVAIYHLVDALQAVCAFILRCYRMTLLPLIIYSIMLWGVGLWGAFVWAYEGIGPLTARAEVSSFWAAASFALCVVSLAFIALVLWVAKQRRL